MLTALKPSFEHDRKHIVRLLRLYGDSLEIVTKILLLYKLHKKQVLHSPYVYLHFHIVCLKNLTGLHKTIPWKHFAVSQVVDAHMQL